MSNSIASPPARTRCGSLQLRARAEQERRRRGQRPNLKKTFAPPTFRGAARDFQSCLDPEVVLDGPAETGKTFAILWRLHALAREKPIQAAIVRKYHVDLHSSVLQTFERKVLARDPTVRVRIYGGSKAEWYDYPSGARIWVAGLDRGTSEAGSKVLSAEYDVVYVNQAEQLLLEEWETLGSRTTGRAGNQPFGPEHGGALWGDCNPRGRGHWILERARAQSLRLFKTFHRDNPALFDDAGQPTAQGARTLRSLSRLTGTRRKRLFEGLWVTPEGAVYEEFDEDVHVRRRDAREFQYWFLALDEGLSRPAVILLVGVDADLRLHVAREFYRRGVLNSKIAKRVDQWATASRTRLVVVDQSAAGLIAEIENVNAALEVVGSKGRVQDGIGLVKELLAVAADGRPRLTVDPECVNTINEFESYLHKPGSELVVKENDHAMDALRYGVFYLFGSEVEQQELVDPHVDIGPDY